jgi:hypothetical protein
MLRFLCLPDPIRTLIIAWVREHPDLCNLEPEPPTKAGSDWAF